MAGKPRSIFVLIVVVVSVCLAVLPRLFSGDRSQRNAKQGRTSRGGALAVRTEIVRADTLAEKIATVGTVLANEEVDIRSETSGKIGRVYFDEGSRVQKGDMLVKIDDTEQQAQLLRARSRRALAEQQETRAREMFSQRLVSDADYDRAKSELDVAKAEEKVVEAQIDKTSIRAPFGGVIGLRYVSEGGYISPATRIATLQDNQQVKIDFSVPEKYSARIKEGDPINFTVPGSSRVYTGTIYALESRIDPATRTLRVRALAPNTDGALFAGAFANVDVLLGEKEALMIPAYALVPDLKGQKVFVYRGGKAVPQTVEAGTRTDQRVEITLGLQAGDTLITSAVLQLRPGAAVSLAEQGEAAP
jgi:membrane fusion protein (multidrug efflux system)